MAYKIKSGVAARLIKCNYYIVQPEKMKLVKLNASGSLVLKGIKAGKTPEAIAKILGKRYALSAGKAERDVRGFVKQLIKENIIQKC